MRTYTVQAVVHGRMGEEQFRIATYEATEQLLDAGIGYFTARGHCILRDMTIVELTLTVEGQADAKQGACTGLTHLLIAAEGYLEGLEEDKLEAEAYEGDFEGEAQSEPETLGENLLAGAYISIADDYGEDEFVLLYAEGFFEGDAARTELLDIPGQLVHLGLRGSELAWNSWHDVLEPYRVSAKQHTEHTLN